MMPHLDLLFDQKKKHFHWYQYSFDGKAKCEYCFPAASILFIKFSMAMTMRMMLGGFPVDVFGDVEEGDNEDEDDDEKEAEEQKDSRGASLCSIMKFTGG